MSESTSEYPKWVKREPHIGAVLCLDKSEEDKLRSDWADEKLKTAEAEAKAAKEAAAAAEEEAKLALKARK